jgi:hypothetical protein
MNGVDQCDDPVQDALKAEVDIARGDISESPYAPVDSIAARIGKP